MKPYLWILGVLCVVGVVQGCSSKKGGGTVNIVYTSSVLGEIEPCG